MARAFYSVVQYCPDRFRAETVNVGLVLLRPEAPRPAPRMMGNLDRVRKLFGIAKPEVKNLRLSISALGLGIEDGVNDFRTCEDLSAFAAAQANDLRLTEPRLAVVDNFDEDFERLFSQLARRRPSRPGKSTTMSSRCSESTACD